MSHHDPTQPQPGHSGGPHPPNPPGHQPWPPQQPPSGPYRPGSTPAGYPTGGLQPPPQPNPFPMGAQQPPQGHTPTPQPSPPTASVTTTGAPPTPGWYAKAQRIVGWVLQGAAIGVLLVMIVLPIAALVSGGSDVPSSTPSSDLYSYDYDIEGFTYSEESLGGGSIVDNLLPSGFAAVLSIFVYILGGVATAAVLSGLGFIVHSRVPATR